MNLDLYNTFVMVVQKRSFSEAARWLNLTQPAVSRHIRELERVYGTSLIARSGSGAEPTEAGRALYQHALELLAVAQKMNRDMEKFSGIVRGKVVIGASTIPGEYILPALIGEFKEKHPRVEVRLQIGNSERIAEKVLRREVDLGVIGIRMESRRLKHVNFVEDRLVLIVPPSHRLAQRGEVNVEELTGEVFVWRESGSGTRGVVEYGLKTAGIDPERLNIAAELGSTEALITGVEAGLGIAFVSCWAARKPEELGRIKVLNVTGVSLNRALYFVYPDEEHLSPAAEGFLQFGLSRSGIAPASPAS